MIVEAANFLSSKIKLRHLLPVKTQKWNIQNSIVFWLGPRDKKNYKKLKFPKNYQRKKLEGSGEEGLDCLIYY